MSATCRTTAGIAYDRAGPPADRPVVLLHAGVADRRMWEPMWPDLTARYDVVRLDLRGFGESTTRPQGKLSPVDDLLDTLAELGIESCHLVGASFGAGVAAEVALTRPALVESMLLAAPGGALIGEPTADLRAFIENEDDAISRNDLDAAVEANLATWVDGAHRGQEEVEPALRERVGRMQRQAFEVTADWDDVEEAELDPPVLYRLEEIPVRTLVLVGALDLDAIHDAAHRVANGIPGARRVYWPDTAHLPSMEHPGEFTALLTDWLA